jgi:hypothetical protein
VTGQINDLTLSPSCLNATMNNITLASTEAIRNVKFRTDDKLGIFSKLENDQHEQVIQTSRDNTSNIINIKKL